MFTPQKVFTLQKVFTSQKRVYIKENIHFTESDYITESNFIAESVYIRMITSQKVFTSQNVLSSEKCDQCARSPVSPPSYLKWVTAHFFLQLFICETLADESLRVVDCVLWVMFGLFSSSMANQDVFATTNHHS